MKLSDKINFVFTALRAVMTKQKPAEKINGHIYIVQAAEDVISDMLYLGVVLAANGLRHLPIEGYAVYKKMRGKDAIVSSHTIHNIDRLENTAKIAVVEKEVCKDVLHDLAYTVAQELFTASIECGKTNPARIIYVMPKAKAEYFAYMLEHKYGVKAEVIS